MKLFCRIWSFLLAVTLVAGMVTIPASAEGTSVSSNAEAVSLEGSGDLGELLNHTLMEQTQTAGPEETEYAPGYGIIDLTIDGSAATVTLDSMEDAYLIVGIYTEDGRQLLVSGYCMVSAGDTTAMVELEGSMPEYFLASAYLADTFDFSPLCQAYQTTLYVQAIQDLLGTGAGVYDPERVLLLTEDKTDNFVVFTEGTILVRPSEGVNTVISADEEQGIYVVENADERIASLQPGDVLVYPYSATEMLITQVTALSIDGSTVTVTGTQASSEIIEYAKLGAVSQTAPAASLYRAIDPISCKGDPIEIPVKFDDDFNALIPNDVVQLSGDGTMTITPEFRFLVVPGYVYLEMRLNNALELNNVTVTGSFVGGKQTLKLAELPVATIIPGVLSLEIAPAIVVDVKGSITTDINLYSQYRATYTSTLGRTKGSVYVSQPEFKPGETTSAAEEYYVAFSVMGYLDVEASRAIPLYEVGVQYELGVNGHFDSYEPDDEDVKHLCEDCTPGYWTLEYYGTMYVEVGGKVSWDANVEEPCISPKHPFYIRNGKWYNEKECTNIEYRTVLVVEDLLFRPVKDVEIFANGESLGKTNEHGTLEVWLLRGEYDFELTVFDLDVETTREVKSSQKIKLVSKMELLRHTILEVTDKIMLLDQSTVEASGTFGELTWTLYKSGQLTISGSGAMNDTIGSYYPWYSYQEKIKAITVESGVTRVGSYAFKGYTALEQLVLADTVTTLSIEAFAGCTGLDRVQLPVDLEYGTYGTVSNPKPNNPFSGCSNVTYIHYTYGHSGEMPWRSTYQHMSNYYQGTLESNCASSLETVKFDDEITSLGAYAFDNSRVSTVVVPDTLTSIGNYAFRGCANLKSIYLPEGITYLGYCAFSWSGLRELKLPSTLTTIEESCFAGCTGLTELVLPNTITTLGREAFANCTGLKRVTLPVDLEYGTYGTVSNLKPNDPFLGCSNVAYIRYTYGHSGEMPARSTYQHMNNYYWATLESNCATSLEMVEVDDRITVLGSYAFYSSNVNAIFFHGDAPSFGYNALSGVRAEFRYPADNATWTNEVMKSLGSGILWLPYVRNADGTVEYLSPVTPTSIEGEESSVELFVATAEAETEPVEVPVVYAVVGGEYDMEFSDDRPLKSASFTGLVPGGQYMVMAMRSVETEEPLSADNLLYIGQHTAMEDGSLFVEYIQQETEEVSYVMACGPSTKDLKDAVITFPEMTADGAVQVVTPTVIYDGKTLEEELDYVIVGRTDFTQAGTYTCYIRGVHNYTGLVECSYTVAEAAPELFNLAGANLELANDITMYFYVYAKDVADGYYMEIVKTNADGSKVTKTVAKADWTAYGSTMYYVGFNGMAAKEIADEISVAVYNAEGTQVSNSIVTSVSSYALRALDSSAYASMHTMMADLLNYGAAAQTFFKYNTGNLANANMTEVHQALATQDFDMSKYTNDAVAGAGAMGANLGLETNILQYFFFDPAVVDSTMTAKVSYTNFKGVKKTTEVSGDKFGTLAGYGFVTVEVAILVPADVMSLVTVEIVDANGNVVASVSDSIASYAVRTNTASPNALYIELMEYCLSCEAFFG